MDNGLRTKVCGTGQKVACYYLLFLLILLTYYFTIGVFSEREVIYIKSIFLILYKVRVSSLSREKKTPTLKIVSK